MDNRDGCLGGIFKLLLLGWLFDWLQQTFGYRSGSCLGCGCGTILLIVFCGLATSIVFGTSWLRIF